MHTTPWLTERLRSEGVSGSDKVRGFSEGQCEILWKLSKYLT